MRLWSLHPSYLDASGLVALWRETLLARKVLLGQTKGYKNHPQLIRFRESSSPIDAINAYLREIHEEARRRGYSFNPEKLEKSRNADRENTLTVTTGQIDYERTHLLNKLKTRSPEHCETLHPIQNPTLHPLFRLVPGNISPWEKIS